MRCSYIFVLKRVVVLDKVRQERVARFAEVRCEKESLTGKARQERGGGTSQSPSLKGATDQSSSYLKGGRVHQSATGKRTTGCQCSPGKGIATGKSRRELDTEIRRSSPKKGSRA